MTETENFGYDQSPKHNHQQMQALAQRSIVPAMQMRGNEFTASIESKNYSQLAPINQGLMEQ